MGGNTLGLVRLDRLSSAPGARVAGVDGGRMGSCSGEVTEARPFRLGPVALYSRCSNSNSVVVQRE